MSPKKVEKTDVPESKPEDGAQRKVDARQLEFREKQKRRKRVTQALRRFQKQVWEMGLPLSLELTQQTTADGNGEHVILAWSASHPSQAFHYAVVRKTEVWVGCDKGLVALRFTLQEVIEFCAKCLHMRGSSGQKIAGKGHIKLKKVEGGRGTITWIPGLSFISRFASHSSVM